MDGGILAIDVFVSRQELVDEFMLVLSGFVGTVFEPAIACHPGKVDPRHYAKLPKYNVTYTNVSEFFKQRS